MMIIQLDNQLGLCIDLIHIIELMDLAYNFI